MESYFSRIRVQLIRKSLDVYLLANKYICAEIEGRRESEEADKNLTLSVKHSEKTGRPQIARRK